MKYRQYDLDEFHVDCIKIAQQLVLAEYHPDYWIALDRGGVIAAATIRREFQNLVPGHRGHLIIKHKDDNWEDLEVFKKSMGQNLLLVDDIVDFGTQYQKSIIQFDKLKEEIDWSNNHRDEVFKVNYAPNVMPRTKHAALIWNVTNKCGVRADFYGQTIDKENNPADNAWIRFWWEGE